MGAGNLGRACPLNGRVKSDVHGCGEIVGLQAMHEAPGATTPTEIELDSAGRRLRFAWGDGRRSDYDWEYLRWRCPCAFCSGEGEYPGALQGRTELRPDETEMIDVELVGRYAVKPTWRDNHDTGIFTFRNLRQLADQDALLTEAPSEPR
jgi:DUF971 family protein